MLANEVWQSVKDGWQYLKDNDAPNWFVFFFGLVVWPLAISIFAYLWTNMPRQSFRGFRVTFSPTRVTIDGTQHDAVLLTFINQTGSTAYLFRARLREVRRRFPVAQEASRDIAGGWRELLMSTNPTNGSFVRYECILQTDVSGGRAYAAIAVKQPMNEKFYSHRPAFWRRWLRRPKYLMLEYLVVVGDRKSFVASVY
jgi:hypothetical protein